MPHREGERRVRPGVSQPPNPRRGLPSRDPEQEAEVRTRSGPLEDLAEPATFPGRDRHGRSSPTDRQETGKNSREELRDGRNRIELTTSSTKGQNIGAPPRGRAPNEEIRDPNCRMKDALPVPHLCPPSQGNGQNITTYMEIMCHTYSAVK